MEGMTILGDENAEDCVECLDCQGEWFDEIENWGILTAEIEIPLK